MNHKRRKPASSRAGCGMCKPWKKTRSSTWDGGSRIGRDNSRTVADRRKILKEQDEF